MCSLPFTDKLFLSILKASILSVKCFRRFAPAEFRVGRRVCAFILSVAVIDLSRHLMRISNLITKVH